MVLRKFKADVSMRNVRQRATIRTVLLSLKIKTREYVLEQKGSGFAVYAHSFLMMKVV